MSFGAKLSKIRTERNMSQEVLAEKVGVSALTIHRWEYEKSAPNINQVKVLCAIFDVQSVYFFEETDVLEELSIGKQGEKCLKK